VTSPGGYDHERVTPPALEVRQIADVGGVSETTVHDDRVEPLGPHTLPQPLDAGLIFLDRER
jgi:hypothetical protein